MRIEITLREKKVFLKLKKDGKQIDQAVIEEKNDLSRKLIFSIDKLLKKNGLKKENIKIIVSKSNIPDYYTADRIAKSLEKTYNFATKNK